MRRRAFINAVACAAAAWPFAVKAQQLGQVRRIGMMNGIGADAPVTKERYAAFLQAFQQLGWTQGSNVQIDYRYADGDIEAIGKRAVELIALAPEVIVSTGAPAT